MSKKHFNILAEAISSITCEEERKRTAELIGRVCANANGSFDWSRWYRACKVEA